MKKQLITGQPSGRRCSSCRASGHRADRCPNKAGATSDDADPEPEPEPERVLAPKKPTAKHMAWLEQLELIKKFQATGDRRILNTLIQQNTGFVHMVARSVMKWHALAYEDIVQEGLMGLMKGIERFDTTKGLKLSTYAVWWIRHQIVRAHEDSGLIRMPARYGIMMSKMGKAKFALEKELKRKPTEQEIADYCKLDIRDVKRINRRGKISESLDVMMHENGEQSLHDVLADGNASHPDDHIQEMETQMQVAKLLASLPERDAAIIRLRYLDGDGMTLAEVGDLLGGVRGQASISRERVRQLEQHALESLKLRARRLKMAA